MKKIFFNILGSVIVEGAQFTYILTLAGLTLSVCLSCYYGFSGLTTELFKGKDHYQAQQFYIPSGNIPIVASN